MEEVFLTIAKVVCIFSGILLLLIIMIQRDRGGGLGGFGGSMGQMAAFGVHTVTVIQKITWWLAAIFLITALSISRLVGWVEEKKVQVESQPESSALETPATELVIEPAEGTAGDDAATQESGEGS